MLWVFLLFLAAVLLLVIAALASSVKLELLLRSSPRWQLRIAARLFGGLSPPLLIHDSARLKRKPQKPVAATKKERKGGTAASGRIRHAVIAAPDLAAGLLRPIHMETLSLDADVGLGDPADTGQIMGLVQALIYSRQPGETVSISVRPDFTALRFSGEAFARLSFIPLAFLPPIIRFAFHLFGRKS